MYENSKIQNLQNLRLDGHLNFNLFINITDSGSSEDENPNGALERFLTAFGLSEYLPKFLEQKIDLDTLMILEESDLDRLNMEIGPRRKLVIAINERKAALENPGEVKDTML